jgi:hypothetical protein
MIKGVSAPYYFKVNIMTDEKPKKEQAKEYTAKKTLFTSKGKVLKGCKFKCSAAEAKKIKENGGI